MSSDDDHEDEAEDSVFKSKYYFNLSDAVQDVKAEFQMGGTANTAKASAKLLGKSVFNFGLLAGKLGVELAKNLPQHVGRIAEQELRNNSNISSERRQKLEEIVEKGKNHSHKQ